jgi:hypothetical protein
MSLFQKGKSGNPGGRPSNAIKTAEVRAALLGNAPKILNNLIKLALNGDIQASKIILDRVISPLRPTEPPIKLEIKKTWNLARQAKEIQRATYAGEISVPQSQVLINNLISQVRIIEATELEERLEKLEKSMGQK